LYHHRIFSKNFLKSLYLYKFIVRGRPQSGGGEGLSSADTGGGDSSDADVRTFWCKKLLIFRNLWCVHTEKGVLS